MSTITTTDLVEVIPSVTTGPVRDLESDDLGDAALPVLAKLLSRHYADAETLPTESAGNLAAFADSVIP